jgi:hypothetical protein
MNIVGKSSGFDFRWFVLFLQNSSVYERVFVYLREI